MSCAVKGNVLRYSGRLNPVFEIQGKNGLRKPLEHLSFGTLTAQGKCFIRQWQHGFRLGFLGDYVHAPATVRASDDVLPLQAYDVADAKSRKTGEQGG